MVEYLELVDDDVPDVNGVPDLELGDVDLYVLRDVPREAPDLQLTHRVVEDAARAVHVELHPLGVEAAHLVAGRIGRSQEDPSALEG